MWTEAARKQHAPRKERYPSDLTDLEWALIAPLIPQARRGGYPRITPLVEKLDADILHTCRLRACGRDKKRERRQRRRDSRYQYGHVFRSLGLQFAAREIHV